MVPREQINKTDTCYYCKKSMHGAEVKYYIWSNAIKHISGKIVFHKQCFIEIAGEEYLLEGY